MTLGRCSNMSEALGSLMGDIDIIDWWDLCLMDDGIKQI